MEYVRDVLAPYEAGIERGEKRAREAYRRIDQYFRAKRHRRPAPALPVAPAAAPARANMRSRFMHYRRSGAKSPKRRPTRKRARSRSKTRLGKKTRRVTKLNPLAVLKAYNKAQGGDRLITRAFYYQQTVISQGRWMGLDKAFSEDDLETMLRWTQNVAAGGIVGANMKFGVYNCRTRFLLRNNSDSEMVLKRYLLIPRPNVDWAQQPSPITIANATDPAIFNTIEADEGQSAQSSAKITADTLGAVPYDFNRITRNYKIKNAGFRRLKPGDEWNWVVKQKDFCGTAGALTGITGSSLASDVIAVRPKSRIYLFRIEGTLAHDQSTNNVGTSVVRLDAARINEWRMFHMEDHFTATGVYEVKAPAAADVDFVQAANNDPVMEDVDN